MHLKPTIKINSLGIGLVEVIAAFGITIVVITALVSLSLFTLRSSLQSKLLLESSKVASRELEWVRSFRDTRLTWDEFRTGMSQCFIDSNPNNRCYMTGATAFATGIATDTIDGQPLRRWFTLDADSANPNDVVRVNVTVEWETAAFTGNTAKSTHVYTYLTNWQNK